MVRDRCVIGCLRVALGLYVKTLQKKVSLINKSSLKGSVQWERKGVNVKYLSWTDPIDFLFSFEQFLLKYIFPFLLSPTKLLGRRFLCRGGCPVCFFFFISFVFLWPEWPENSQNDRKAGMTGKPERPQSQNDWKVGNFGKAGTTGLIPAPIYWGNGEPYVISRCGLNSRREL